MCCDVLCAGGGGVLCDDMGLGKTVQVTTHSVGVCWQQNWIGPVACGA
jgi:SNF2 family DNA or RNA helicase